VWWWYIPLHDDVMSVGIVRPFDELFVGNREHEQIYNHELENCPEVKRRVSMGTRCEKYFATKDYSYRASRNAGEGWVLVGDAYGFLDPLYSSGVLLALKGRATGGGRDLQRDWRPMTTSAAALGKWASEFNVGMERMRRLVVEYYEGFSFGRFVKNNPHLKGHLTDLLIGNLFNDRVAEVFPVMDKMKADAAAAAAAANPATA